MQTPISPELPELPDNYPLYDPLEMDAYLLHLVSLPKPYEVIVTQNIYSRDNVLLAAEGALITQEVADVLSPCRLLKPLEKCINVTPAIDNEKLLSDFIAVVKQDNIFFAVNEVDNFTELLTLLSGGVVEFPFLIQKLTVMEKALPNIYQRSFYCAILSLLIAKEMRLTKEDIANVFLAALSHDIGMLHVDTTILNRETISSNQWMSIQRHVDISCQLLFAMQSIPSMVVQTVYEHHEQADGTGYPLGKYENELSLLGQIVNLSDSIVAIHFNHFKVMNRSWREAIRFIEMNSQAYLSRAHELLLAIVRRAELPVKNVVQGNAMPEFVMELIKKNNQLKNWFEGMRDSLISIGFRHGDKKLHALQNVMLHLSTSVEGSGIFHAQYTDIVNIRNNALPNNIDAVEWVKKLEKLYLQQQEIIFHLQRVSRMTQLYIEHGDCKEQNIKTILALGLKHSQDNPF